MLGKTAVPLMGLVLFSVAGTAAGEPADAPKTRAGFLLQDIHEAMSLERHAFALEKIREYHALEITHAPLVRLLEAKAATAQGEHERALRSLESLLASGDAAASAEARGLYPTLKEKAEAARAERLRMKSAAAAALPAMLAGLRADMIELPGGEFRMGDAGGKSDTPYEQPMRRVSILPFRMGRYEVTFAQYDIFALETDRPLPDDMGWGRGNRPVVNVSWTEARAFTEWLSRKTGSRYRLPSEAEWEYACRAGVQDDSLCGGNDLEAVSWYTVNSDGRTQPVGGKQANAFGLHDMSGNAFEWVEDCWHLSYHGAPGDGAPWIGDCVHDARVVRGGAWYLRGWLRASFRVGVIADFRLGAAFGFRLAEDLAAPAI